MNARRADAPTSRQLIRAAAWRIGSTFIDSDDMAGLSEEKLGKLAGWLVHVEEMQAGLKKIMDVLY